MDYFSIAQDNVFYNSVTFRIKSLNPTQRRIEVTKADADSIKGVFRFDVKSSPDNFYPDILDVPIFLVSNNVAEVFKNYFDAAGLRAALLIDAKNKQHHLYWLPLMNKIDCLHETTVFYKDDSVKTLILSREKVQGHKIFRVGGIMETMVIVHLEIAESLLRRNCTGVSIKPIACV